MFVLADARAAGQRLIQGHEDPRKKNRPDHELGAESTQPPVIEGSRREVDTEEEARRDDRGDGEAAESEGEERENLRISIEDFARGSRSDAEIDQGQQHEPEDRNGYDPAPRDRGRVIWMDRASAQESAAPRLLILSPCTWVIRR